MSSAQNKEDQDNKKIILATKLLALAQQLTADSPLFHQDESPDKEAERLVKPVVEEVAKEFPQATKPYKAQLFEDLKKVLEKFIQDPNKFSMQKEKSKKPSFVNRLFNKTPQAQLEVAAKLIAIAKDLTESGVGYSAYDSFHDDTDFPSSKTFNSKIIWETECKQLGPVQFKKVPEGMQCQLSNIGVGVWNDKGAQGMIDYNMWNKAQDQGTNKPPRSKPEQLKLPLAKTKS